MSAFRALSLAIVRGFLRDKASLFFALVFPLMFLVLFGGLLGDRSQSEVDLVQVGDVPVLDALSPEAAEAFEDTFAVTRTDDLDGALAQVRSGDADVVAVRERIKARLPDYMVPREIRTLDSLPLNSNGKFDREALLGLLEEGP